MNRLYLLFAPLFLFSCQTADSPKKADTPVLQTVRTVAVDSTLIIDRMIQRTNDLLPSAEVHRDYLLMGNGFDTLWTVLYHNGHLPLKLEYTTFEDGGTAFGMAAYYFDSTGLCIAGSIGYDDVTATTGFIGDRVLQFNKQGGKRTTENVTGEEAAYRKLVTSKSLKELMQAFPSVSYKLPKQKDSSVIPMLALEDMVIYASPDAAAAVLCKVEKESSLNFIDAKAGSDIVNGRKWIWFKVNYEQYTGWAFGHPELVAEVNDEVY